MGYTLEPGDSVREAPLVNFSGAWPIPVQARMESFVQRAIASGERTSTRELLAAIVCSFDISDDDWHSLLRNYRNSRVADVLPAAAEQHNVIHLERRRPGRPTASG